MVREEKEQDKFICLNGIPQAEIGGGMSVKNKMNLAVESILTDPKKEIMQKSPLWEPRKQFKGHMKGIIIGQQIEPRRKIDWRYRN